jgi:hypothetical protein
VVVRLRAGAAAMRTRVPDTRIQHSRRVVSHWNGAC